MNDPIKKLVDKILTIQQDDYRVGDIIFKKGPRWKFSGKQVLSNEKYNGTILKSYLEENGLMNQININRFLNISIKYNENNNLDIPSDNELVLHLRLGDYIELKKVLSKPYIKLIREHKRNAPNINKITIVTAFSYGTWTKESLHLKKKETPMWDCTEEKQKKNLEIISFLIEKIKNNFPNLEIDIMSNSDIDKDICYCVNSKHFINDIGGFSELMMKLNTLRQLNN